MSENVYFEKQRDLLIQEIGLSMESVIFHLDTLNRSLGGLVAVGKQFEEVARLWSHFYDGPNQLYERQLAQQERGSVSQGTENEAQLEDVDEDEHEVESVAAVAAGAKPAGGNED